jgi:phosphoserine phosphatase RsbU/P
VASARYTIRSYAFIDPTPEKVLTLANDALCRENGDESHMLTAFLAILDPKAGLMSYASAGHEPPIVCHARGGCEELATGGLPLGMIPGEQYGQFSRKLDPGDIVVAVTDGITEARDSTCDLFGKARLVEFVEQHRNEPPGQIAAGLLDSATAHAGGRLQDDAALVVFSPRANADRHTLL